MLGVRLDAETERKLDVLARRVGRTKSELVRDALRRYLADDASYLAEARRQSLVASSAEDDEDAAAFALALVDAEDES